MNTKNKYRVCTDNDVLNYYNSKKAAKAYMAELERHSPDMVGHSYIEQRIADAWHPIKNACAK